MKPRARWIVLSVVWVAAALLLLYQTLVMRDYLATLTAVGLNGRQPTTPLTQIYSWVVPDSQVWLRHALDLLHGSGPRLRHTFFDNPPLGREVHWDSGWAWAIAGMGALIHSVTPLTLTQGVEQAAIWLPQFTLLCVIILISSLVLKRGSLVGAIVLAVGLACDDQLLQVFAPGNVDHHGIITGAVGVLVLGGILMGAGWWREGESPLLGLLPSSLASARRGAILSALGGATAMWIGAASAIPPITFVGIAGIVVTLVFSTNARANGAQCNPDLWRLWGRTGAIACIAFYLLEYFPNHLGLRLEVNHPLYAIAWYGGGEIIAQCCEWKVRPTSTHWQPTWRLYSALVAVLLAPTVVFIGGARVFLLFDPLISRLHTGVYVGELRSTIQNLKGLGGFDLVRGIAYNILPILVASGSLIVWRRRIPLALAFALVTGILLTAMGWWQVRWLANGAISSIFLVAILLSLVTARLRNVQRWGVIALALLVLYVPSPWMRNVGAADRIRGGGVDDQDRTGAVFRDIAAALRASQPEGQIVVLSSPDAALGVSYYGGFSAVGTLYWENAAGARAAADFYSATNAESARAIAAEHRVTHLVIIPNNNFVREYFEVRHPGEDIGVLATGFLTGLVERGEMPEWITPLPYSVPPDLRVVTDTVLIYRINANAPRQNP